MPDATGSSSIACPIAHLAQKKAIAVNNVLGIFCTSGFYLLRQSSKQACVLFYSNEVGGAWRFR